MLAWIPSAAMSSLDDGTEPARIYGRCAGPTSELQKNGKNLSTHGVIDPRTAHCGQAHERSLPREQCQKQRLGIFACTTG
jgi:hypothetical protein